jgi:dipeptidyl aminopeptidase/acylaminoacyl peptidase
MRPALILILGVIPVIARAQSRPMTFLDVQHFRNIGGVAVSPDQSRVAYTLSIADWKEGRRQTDVFAVSVAGGIESTRRLTFTGDKSETGPRWLPDNISLVFSSDRDGTGENPPDQLYLMRVDGGEARKITDVKDGVAAFDVTRDGRWIVYAAGKAEERQLWALPVAGLDSSQPVQLTRHPTPVRQWQLSYDGRRVFFLSPDTLDQDNRSRREKKFTVNIRNEEQPADHLWMVDLASRESRRLTGGTGYSVSAVTQSRDGRWLGFRGTPNDRYQRNVTETSIYGDAYLLEIASGKIERLTSNTEVPESPVSFSPDGSIVAISAPNDWTYFRDGKLWVRPTAAPGSAWRKLGADYDGDLNVGWWSDDGKTIYTTDGVKGTNQVLAVSVETGAVRQVTGVAGSVSAGRDDETGAILVYYADPATPTDLWLAGSPQDLGDRARWRRLTRANPQAEQFALGEASELSWKSKDGRTVGGVLVKPVGYQPGRRYPLVVQIHGGPASAYVLGWNPGVNAMAYAGQGYAVLLPNYRGSTNYGEQHRLDIVGDYFRKGYEDIMTGVDALIEQGIAHPDSLGVMGWSAGGHWSNWIMTQTNRFKAVSSGAGAVNWISMYAQSDVQRNRAEYFARGKKPWEDFEAYWRVSPLRYIRNARTPTLIHVVDGDPRVPRPQSEELHMALKQQGVPTEFFVYPGNTHGIPDPRNQYLKAVAEFQWFEKWIRGRPWFTWKDLLKTIEDAGGPPTARTAGRGDP